MRPSSNVLLVCAFLASATVALLARPQPAVADATDDARAARCATRLSIAVVGEAATPALLASTNPQSSVDALLADARFVERFARFINAQLNLTPGATPAEDATYYLAKHVITNGKPWSDMFIGKYDVVPSNPQQAGSEARVVDDPDGLGYFRSRTWMVRYAGNEPGGMRIVAAYRILWNTIGLALVATTNAPDADVSASGREAGQCRGCHLDSWYALDKVADVLGKRRGTGTNTQFDPAPGEKKTILGGVPVANDAELVNALVTNEAFDVNACRLAWKYLYGRTEVSCEGPAFDRCVDAFKKDKRMVTALATVAKDPTFCE